MKSISRILVAITVLLSTALCDAQTKNTKTETVKIFGNCGMCKTKIEKAGNLKNIAEVDWNEDTKIATLTYDESKTNQDEILKRIALVGYDSEKFLAPADAYSKLPGCCQYDREAKVAVKAAAVSGATKLVTNDPTTMAENQDPSNGESNQLQAVFDNYFLLKDALVKTDSKTAAAKSKELLASITDVKMETLKMGVHVVWMKVLNDLKEDAKHISDAKDIEHQRAFFATLSNNMYQLIKVSKPKAPIYYQHCPMANDGKGADWLSKENAIKNPYYGSQMLTCGKTVETIK